jgi:hypothetical protein
MSILKQISSVFIPDLSSASGLAPAGRYKRLWRIMVIVNYYQDQRAYDAEMYHLISQILGNGKHTLDFILEERRSVLMMVINDKDYSDLIKEGALTSTLRNLKSSFGGFIDLGLIDARGIQTHYSGPYDLQGKDYRDQAWFHEVSLRGVYISDVFMGYRKFPHFVITTMAERLDYRDIEAGFATNGVDALLKLRNEHYDAVIIDLKMPGMSGAD